MLKLSPELLAQIHQHGAFAYPEEGAGFLLGRDGGIRKVIVILPLVNAREENTRHNRYLITPEDYLKGELEADRHGLTLLGVFHSHPDHPNRPSEFDRQWAQPFFSYLITSVRSGHAVDSKSWRLSEDRSTFQEETLSVGE